MNRLILALALTPALFTTGAFAQAVPDDVAKQLWCGTAFVTAFSSPPPGVPAEQLALAKLYIDQGNEMIDGASQKYLDTGFTEEQLTKVKADLVTEVTAAVGGSGGSAKYTFEECKALMPNPPADVPQAEAPTSDAPPADAPSSSAAQ
ncbi:MAG: hypothetical protein ABI398_12545 [Devosia sp.]